MKLIKNVLTDPDGLHARPAGELVKLLKTLDISAKIICGEKTADARKIFQIMTLGAKRGDEIVMEISGDHEEQAAKAVMAFLEENL